MAIYAQVERWTDQWGVVQRVEDMGSHVPEAAPPKYAIDTTGYTPVPVTGEAWWYDFTNDLFTNTDPAITKPTPTPRVPKTDAADLWLNRFTAQERAIVWAICNGETPPGVTINLENRYRVGAFKDLTLTGMPFKLDNTELTYVVNGLETAGALASGRAAEILT